jgi:hypothetical protein
MKETAPSIVPEAAKPAYGEAQARREFLENVGKAAATAPAIALLLAASEKAALAQVNDRYGSFEPLELPRGTIVSESPPVNGSAGFGKSKQP